MGSVYRARDTRLNREVAIKLLNEGANRGRLQAEARALASLNHPNIVSIFDVGDSFLVTELIEGAPLKATGTRNAIELVAQCADGLAAAHSLGIWHRDLKPDNILVTHGGRVKLIDFGLAKLNVPGPDDRTRTIPGTVMGTVVYMSPEQVRGVDVDGRSDIFTLGVILFEMVAGVRPFSGETAAHVMTRICDEDSLELPDSLPAALRQIIYRCLAKEPRQRFQSASDLAFALRNLSATSVSTARPEAAVVRRGWTRRYLWVVGTLLMGVVAGAAGSLWLAPSEAKLPRYKNITYSGRDTQPAVAADGKTIAFTSDRDGYARIWLKQLQSGEESAITTGEDEWPRFSPDGGSLLFIRKESGRKALYRVATIGGEPRKLLDDVVNAEFSPQGGQIAYVRWQSAPAPEGTLVGLINSNGSQAQDITVIAGLRLEHPRFSADGKTVALVGGEQSGYHGKLVLLDVLTRKYRTLPVNSVNAELSTVAWGPSQGELFYLRQDGYFGDSQLVRQNTGSGALSSVSWQYPSASLEISGAGQILFAPYSIRESLQEIDLSSGKQAEAKWRARSYSTDRQPVYSPGGESILFVSNRTGNTDIWQVATKTGVVTRLIEEEGEDIDPAFTPDGRILWSSNRNHGRAKDTGQITPFNVYMASAQGTQPRRVTNEQYDAQNPSMTRDGKWIVYASSDPAKTGIWKIHPDGSGASILASGPFFIPEASPTGEFALYIFNSTPDSNEIRVVRVADAAEVPFRIRLPIRRHSVGLVGRARWMPDGKSIVFLAQDEYGQNGIYCQAFQPGQDTTATRRLLFEPDENASVMTFGVSADGKRITSSNWEQVSSLTMADHVPLGIRPRQR